jgi:SEC-C motif
MEEGGEFRLCRVDKIGGNEVTSKRRKGFPSETQVKRGTRVVGGCKELSEKLGRNDPCPCLSGRRFQELCMLSGELDGSDRHHFFQRLRRHLCFVVSDCQDELANAAIGSTYTVAAFCCLRSQPESGR